MELAVAALLVSSLTCVGLLALWAATSSRHWFLRTAVLVGTLSLLLLIPAYEPFVAFAIQGAVVAAGVQLTRHWQRTSSDPPTKRQFSLATLLQAMVFVAIAAAVAPNLPPLNLAAWQSVLLIGCIDGLATLTGRWMWYGSRFRWMTRIVLGLGFALILCTPLHFGDWFVESVTVDMVWPPEPVSLGTPMFVQEGIPFITWAAVTPLVVFITFLTLSIFAFLLPSDTGSVARRRNAAWSLAIATFALVLGVCLALPSAVVYYRLVTPLPVPAQQFPEPNGHEDFKAAWKMLGPNLLIDSMNFDPHNSPISQLGKAVDQVRAALSKGREGLTRPALFPIDYDTGLDLHINDIQKMRSLAWAFRAEGVLAVREQQFENALETFLETVDYGIHARRGGLIVTEFVGIACSSVGRSDLYHMRTELTAEQCRHAIDRIKAAIESTELHEHFALRDRIWTQHSYDWVGHLVELLENYSGDYRFFDPTDYDKPFLREQAEMRLLIAELALQAYHLEHGQLPARLTELVPEYLPEVPIDPLSEDSLPLKYRLTEDGYLLYSVGHDGVDDGGAVPDDEENFLSLSQDTGDLRLDVQYAPYEEDETEEEAEDSFETEQ